MSKRLQVLLGDEEYAAMQEAATARGFTLSEWARQALRQARRAQSIGSVDAKLAAVESALQHAFPTGDIDQMLAEIAAGYAE